MPYSYDSLLAELPPGIALRQVPAMVLDRLGQVVYGRFLRSSRGKVAPVGRPRGPGAGLPEASDDTLDRRAVARLVRWACSLLCVLDARVSWFPPAVITDFSDPWTNNAYVHDFPLIWRSSDRELVELLLDERLHGTGAPA